MVQRWMNDKKYFAHKDHLLSKHLEDVGEIASEFAKTFDASLHGKIAGLLHDLGKTETEFQKRLLSDDKQGKKEPHAHHGAMIALKNDAWPIAFVVNGHHTGLHNRSNVNNIKREYSNKAEKNKLTIPIRHVSKLRFPVLIYVLIERLNKI